MARSTDQPSQRSKHGNSAESAPLGLDGITLPDDQGLSLDELSQAYAALVGKGADPYPDGSSASDPPPAELPAAVQDLLPETKASDEDSCEISPQTILEAILFVGHPTGEPLTTERIAALMRGVRPSEVDDYVLELNERYTVSGAPYTIVSVGAGYQLCLRSEFASLRDAFYGRIREVRLSQATIDVLAIVAYHQPIAIEEIDRLRGKASGPIVSQLLRRDLLQVDRAGQGGAKPTYRTSDRFLELFGLDGLADLPQSEER